MVRRLIQLNDKPTKMISELPWYVNVVFILTTIVTVFMFYKATNGSASFLLVTCAWLVLQAMLGYTGFFTITNNIPPRFPLLALPAILLVIGLFVFEKGGRFIDTLDTKMLTLLHIVRIPVEICLYWLFLHKSVPQLMTFAGRNFDILAGITAPLVYYWGYIKNKLGRPVLITWNFICLALLLNIVGNAVLSTPSPVQQFGLEQPNTAVLYFPFTWLPACIVPLVLLAHVATIRQLFRKV